MLRWEKAAVHLRALTWEERIRLDGLGMVEGLNNRKGKSNGAAYHALNSLP